MSCAPGRITTPLCTVLLLASVCAQAQGVRLSRKEIPVAVVAAFEKDYPKATLKHAMKEQKDGHVTYEIESLDGTTGRDLQYLADGTLIEIEETLPMSGVPESVKASVAGKYPKGKIVKAEKVTRGAKVSYDIEIKEGKRKVALDLDDTGTILAKE